MINFEVLSIARAKIPDLVFKIEIEEISQREAKHFNDNNLIGLEQELEPKLGKIYPTFVCRINTFKTCNCCKRQTAEPPYIRNNGFTIEQAIERSLQNAKELLPVYFPRLKSIFAMSDIFPLDKKIEELETKEKGEN